MSGKLRLSLHLDRGPGKPAEAYTRVPPVGAGVSDLLPALPRPVGRRAQRRQWSEVPCSLLNRTGYLLQPLPHLHESGSARRGLRGTEIPGRGAPHQLLVPRTRPVSMATAQLPSRGLSISDAPSFCWHRILGPDRCSVSLGKYQAACCSAMGWGAGAEPGDEDPSETLRPTWVAEGPGSGLTSSRGL